MCSLTSTEQFYMDMNVLILYMHMYIYIDIHIYEIHEIEGFHIVF